jgi:four helix bundle protein
MGVRVFTDLFMWKDSRAWSKAIYQHTRTKPFANDKRLVTQINDSSASVPANIAEGLGRGTQGQFVQFLGYAIGSLNETQSHLAVAYDPEYISKDDYVGLFAAGIEIRKKIVKFIQQMVMPQSGVKNIKKPKMRESQWESYERITGKERPLGARRMAIGLPWVPFPGEVLTPEQIEALKPQHNLEPD